MLSGLTKDKKVIKMSKSDPSSAIYMEDTEVTKNYVKKLERRCL